MAWSLPISTLARPRVLVIGDPVVDVYIHGTTERISREAPVLIVAVDQEEHRLGGAANTARNCAALGASTRLLGLVGEDAAAKALTQGLDAAGVGSALIRSSDWRTTSKTRVLAGGLHTTKQQMLRLDRQPRGTPPSAVFEGLSLALEHHLAWADVVIVSDYGPAELTAWNAEAAERAAARMPVVVDSRFALQRYRSVTAMTPNEPEVEQALGRPLRSVEKATAAGRELCEALDLEVLVVTRGREGMVVVPRTGPSTVLPAHGGEAVDVTGAGDTVTAVFSLALAADWAPAEAAQLANVAAGSVVMQVGTGVCTPDRLEAAGKSDP